MRDISIIEVIIEQLMEGESALISKYLVLDTLDQLKYEHNKVCTVTPEDIGDHTKYRLTIVEV